MEHVGLKWILKTFLKKLKIQKYYAYYAISDNNNIDNRIKIIKITIFIVIKLFVFVCDNI